MASDDVEVEELDGDPSLEDELGPDEEEFDDELEDGLEAGIGVDGDEEDEDEDSNGE